VTGSREPVRVDFPSAGLTVAAYRWDPQGAPRAIVQITHGMGEHALRYAGLAGALNSRGMVVVAQDQRGHGATAGSEEELGQLGAQGWAELINDIDRLRSKARAEYPGIPLVLLGHSMGSFAAQQYILDHSRLIAGVALSGSVAVDKLTFDSSRPTDLSSLNSGIENPRTAFDWLSRDPAAVDAYVADPRCGFGANARAVQSMAAAARRLTDPAELRRIRPDLPIYIFAGDRDPLNRGLEWLKPVAERYRAAGVRNVAEKYYPGGRHEMLNEINRGEVIEDFQNWLRRILSK